MLRKAFKGEENPVSSPDLVRQMESNQLTDLRSLADLRFLSTLRVAGNQITSLAPLMEIELLRELTMKNNPQLGRAEAGDLRRALPRLEIDFFEK